MEIWRDITGYEELYQVSNLGRVKSLGNDKNRKEKILKPSKNKCGYLTICLHNDNKIKNFKVHRLVAEAFIPNPENKPEVNHEDGNKENCCVSNLTWATKSENMMHAYKKNLINTRKVVLQFDNNNNLVKEWFSIREAERSLKIKHQSICRCCLGKRKTAGGYKWEYKKV